MSVADVACRSNTDRSPPQCATSTPRATATASTAASTLAKVADVQLSNTQRDALNSLNKERNKLQHFGSTSNHEVVTIRAAAVLDVLSEFIQHHLVPDAPDDETEHLDQAEELIATTLTTISAVHQARSTRIAPELDAWQGIIIHCPECMGADVDLPTSRRILTLPVLRSRLEPGGGHRRR